MALRTETEWPHAKVRGLVYLEVRARAGWDWPVWCIRPAPKQPREQGHRPVEGSLQLQLQTQDPTVVVVVVVVG